jgi:hypothetical protein
MMETLGIGMFKQIARHLMSHGLGQILNTLKSSPIVLLVGVLVVILSSLLTLANGLSFLLKQFQSTLGFPTKLRAQLRRLSAGVTIGFFRELLGPDVFARTNGSRREHIFINKYCYVQAVTDLEGTVVAFSVTTRKRWFHPKLVLGPYSLTGEKLKVRLGRTKFFELQRFARPQDVSSSLGAHSFHYSEEYYFGNPGKYQTFVFAINDAGHCQYSQPPTHEDCATGVANAAVAEFRNRSVINTYTIVAPLVSAKDAMGGFWFGADKQQVRILDGPQQRISRRQLRRMREIIELGPYRYFAKMERRGRLPNV